MNNYNKKTSIIDFLLEHSKKDPISFHMPGHKGSKFYRMLGYGDFLDYFMDCDITEIEGADNLFQAESIIKNTIERYEKLYQVKKTYLLINGTSCGLISAILATVKQGGKLIMARNSHKSVFNAVSIGGITPIYAYPELIQSYGISGEIKAEEIERLIRENPDAQAVVLPSPNYYGICSDIKEISEIVHRAGKILIVDQAHGAHLKFFEHIATLPESAESCGADIVVNSIHKTLGSFTQSALMNVVTDKVDLDLLEDKLQAIESTSPSYLLMASLDINADVLEKEGVNLMSSWYHYLKEFYHQAELINGLKIINTGKNMDYTKINIDMSEIGISGHELEQLLINEKIYVELVTGNIVMCMTGIGNDKNDYNKLIAALKKISDKNISNSESDNYLDEFNYENIIKSIPKQVVTNHIPKEKMRIAIDLAEGCTCAVSLIPYPPGIPLVCPGEIITKEVINYIKALRMAGEKVMGIDESDSIIVGRI